MTEQTTIEPIRVSVLVPLKPADAFALFTDKMATWWPVASHSIGGSTVVGVVFEGRVGGAICEVQADGTREPWGEVLEYEPGRRFVMSWQPSPDAPAPTEVEVVFEADGDGTRVALEHRGWERLGELAAEARSEYARGWTTVLACYTNVA